MTKATCHYCGEEVEVTNENIMAHAFGICLKDSDYGRDLGNLLQGDDQA